MLLNNDMLILSSQEIGRALGSRGDQRWSTALKIAENGDLYGAARLISDVLEGQNYTRPQAYKDIPKDKLAEFFALDAIAEADGLIPNMVVGTINNLAFLKGKFDKDVLTMACKAVEAGLVEYAYNVANHLLEEAKTPSDYQQAEHYYKIAILTADDDNRKAAAYVNYCPIIRDGLISGQPDWPKAIEIYEEAAKLGLIIGMFNTANVCSWLQGDLKTQYQPKALYWLEKAIQHLEEGKPRLEMDDDASCEAILEQAKVAAATIHIEGGCTEADFNRGIQILRGLPYNQNNNGIKRWYLDYGYAKRIGTLTKPQENTPAHNWKYLFNAIDWRTSDIEEYYDAGEFFFVAGEGRGEPNIPVFVASDFFFPGEGRSLIQFLQETGFFKQHPLVILLSPYGAFRYQGQRNYVGATVVIKGKPHLVALRAGATPEELVKAASSKTKFFNDDFGSSSCVIPIAINRFRAGIPVNDGFRFDAPYRVAEDWCIPWELDEFDIQIIR